MSNQGKYLLSQNDMSYRHGIHELYNLTGW